MLKLFIGYTLLGVWVIGILALVLFFILKFRMYQRYKKLAEIENKNKQ